MLIRPLGCLALSLALVAGLRVHASPSGQAPAPPPAVTAYRPVLDRYCVTCHNQRLKTGGVVLDTANLANVRGNGELWEKVLGKLRSASMPPLGLPRPDQATYTVLASALEDALDRAAAASPNPGRVPAMHRLNRAEYRNAIRDLLALDVDVATMLPSDSGSYGFDNIAGVLSISPALMERYLSAAHHVSAVAVGATVAPRAETFRVAGDLLQDDRLMELPFGTRGGTAVQYTFPQDGEYEIRLRLARTGHTDALVGLAERSEIEVSIDGERVQLFTVGGQSAGRGAPPVGATNEPDPDSQDAPTPPARQTAQPSPENPNTGTAAVAAGPKPARGDPGAQRPNTAGPPPPPREAADARLRFRVPVKAGPRRVVVTFLKRTAAYAEPTIQPYARVNSGQGGDSRYHPYLSNVVISGPFNGTPPKDTPSRRRIFVCDPGSTAATEDRCARQILSTLARRAYRRPVADTELRSLVDFFTEGRARGSFEKGIELALRRLLVDPEFLFRIERDPSNIAPNTSYRVSDLELASRLSFFLWSSGPDDELLEAAARGRLKDPVVLGRQVRRMLEDRRADALTVNFAGQWLYLRNVPSLIPDEKLYPDFDDSLRQAMRRETELFFESIMREDRSVVEFLNANYTFLNERLARHYGIRHVYGSDFRRVTLNDPSRGGLLGHASILAATSEPTRTSPVRRGKWVLENLLGAPPPPPPPDVPSLTENEVGSTKVLSMRAQMEGHRSNPACEACHKLMDPIGLALENFDALGRWRTREPWMLTVEDQKWRPNEADEPIDAAGTLPDGTAFVGPAGLKAALVGHSDHFITALTEKLLTYGLGRGVEYYDRPAIRKIVREAALDRNRFSAIVIGIVNSVPFRMRMSAPVPGGGISSAQ